MNDDKLREALMQIECIASNGLVAGDTDVCLHRIIGEGRAGRCAAEKDEKCPDCGGPWEVIVFEHAPITRVNPTGVRFTLVNSANMREIGPFTSEPEAIAVRSVLNQLGVKEGRWDIP